MTGSGPAPPHAVVQRKTISTNGSPRTSPLLGRARLRRAGRAAALAEDNGASGWSNCGLPAALQLMIRFVGWMVRRRLAA